jgi:hypothetical protein
MVSASTGLPRFDDYIDVDHSMTPLAEQVNLWLTSYIQMFAYHPGYVLAYQLQSLGVSGAAILGQNHLQTLVGLVAAGGTGAVK